MMLPIRVEPVDAGKTDLHFVGEFVAVSCPSCGEVWGCANRETSRIHPEDCHYSRANGCDLVVCGLCGQAHPIPELGQ